MMHDGSIGAGPDPRHATSTAMGSDGVDDQSHGTANIREVIALLEGVRKEWLAEIDKLNTKIDARLEAHYTRHETDHDAHRIEHQRENDRRTGYIRWAVTSILTGIGVVVAIYATVRGG